VRTPTITVRTSTAELLLYHDDYEAFVEALRAEGVRRGDRRAGRVPMRRWP